MATIIFNGKSYNSADEMPANERQAYEHMLGIFVDKNGNGIPDFMEGDMASKVFTAFTSSVNFNGRTYDNLNDLPPETRRKIEQAFGKMKALGIMPADPPMNTALNSSSSVPTFEPAFQPSQPLISQQVNPVTETNTLRNVIIIAVVLGALLCGAVAVILYLIR